MSEIFTGGKKNNNLNVNDRSGNTFTSSTAPVSEGRFFGLAWLVH